MTRTRAAALTVLSKAFNCPDCQGSWRGCQEASVCGKKMRMPTRDWIRKLPSYRNHGLSPFDVRLLAPYASAVAIVGVAFFIRWLFDALLPPGFPFLTFFPAVIITAFAFGLWPSVMTGTLGLWLSWYFFVPTLNSFALESGGILALVFYLFIVIVDILLTHLAIGAIVESDGAIKAKEDLTRFQDILIRELDHRIKNLFAVVASVVKLSARYADSSSELAEDASARILALSRSHSSLWRLGKDADATVQSIAGQVLEPFLASHAGRIRITGTSPVLDIRLVQILSLIFHELATNAVKYGALAGDNGEVTISSPSDDAQSLSVVWEESVPSDFQDGAQKGFGTELIERLINGAGGTLTRLFENGRMTTSLNFPAP